MGDVSFALALVNLGLLILCLNLLRWWPCWMAAVSMGLYALGMVFLVVGYGAEAHGTAWGRDAIMSGFFIEHIGVGLSLFRLWWQRGEAKWRSSLAQPEA